MGKKRKRGTKSLKLSDDLIIDIISRVPEKDLQRFKCFSKSWCSLITDSYFSQLRSQRTVLRGRPFLIINISEPTPQSEDRLYYTYWLELDSMGDGNLKSGEINNPFFADHYGHRRDASVIGSCDGLLVFQFHRHIHDQMVVSNPTTKKYHVVPPDPAGVDNVMFIGFGYDHVHGCYKLVTRIVRASGYHHVHDVELMIYNFNNCTWKKSRFDGLVNDYYYSQSCYCRGECVDGALYWGVTVGTEMEKILCFVLAEEEFHEVDLPDFDEVMIKSYVAVFDGRLCLVCESPCHDRVEFWLMECDYKRQLGPSYSRRWIKFLSILDRQAMLPRSILLPHHFRLPFLMPICFSACKTKILFNVNYEQLFWYDVGKNEFQKLENRPNTFHDHTAVFVTSCVPSLVDIGISKRF